MKRIAVILGSNSQSRLPLSDRAAIGLAIRSIAGEVHAFTVRDDEPALRYALAAGAVSAKVLQDFNELDFDITLVGDGGCGPWGDLLPAKLAAERGAALLLSVIDVELTTDGARVTRDLGRGAREILRAHGPVVLGISDDAPQRMYVSRYRRSAALAAFTSATQTLNDPHANAATPWELARTRTRTGNLAAKTGGAATDRFNMLVGATSDADNAGGREIIQADAATCAKHLLRYLRHHGFIAGASLEPSPLGRGQGEETHGLQAAPIARHPSHPGIPSPHPSPNGRGGQSPRLLRGPRRITGESSGITRRPRPLTSTPSIAIALPPRFARRPHGLNESSPRARGPVPFPGATPRHA